MSLIRTVYNNVAQIPGWRTDKKIVVFESDDWGMVRMSSKKSYDKLIKKGYPLRQCTYSSNDAVEQNSDVAALLEVLTKFRNSKERSPIFTINNVVANPNFEKILKSDFNNYFRETCENTYKSYAHSDKVLDLFYEGIESKLVFPQYHATEHMNLNRWMFALQSKDNKKVLDAFFENMYTLYAGAPSSCHHEFLDSYGLGHREEYQTFDSILNEGLNIFEKIWGFRSTSFIAPCYIWPTSLEKHLSKYGVRYIQGTRIQRNAVNSHKRFKRRFHYTGEKNKLSQIYLVRNVFFEPSENPEKNHVDSAMAQIEFAFKFKKPAIISTHRVNYIGRLNAQNRDNGLKQLEALLKKILSRWPEVEFLTTNELGNLISNKK